MNHAWAFATFAGGRQVKNLPTCLFNIEGFSELETRSVKFGELRVEYLSMHLKKGALAISPNNHRVLIDPGLPINKCWTLSLSDDGVAIVTLQWLLTRSDFSAAFLSCSTLGELLSFLGDYELDKLFNRI